MKPLLIFTSLLALSSLAAAQGETLGTYFDAAGTQTSTTAAPLSPFQVYFICDNIPAGVAGYEFTVNMPPELLILGVTAHPVGTSLDVDASNEGFIVGTGTCLFGPGPIVLAEFTCMALAPATGLQITLSPASPSSFGGTDPGYAECGTLALYPFADAYSGPATVDIQHEGAFCFCDGSGSAAPCGNMGGPGNGCANSASAAGANLDADGTASVNASTLVLFGSNLPPNKPGLFFQGTNQVNGGAGAIFGDGLLCAGGTIQRLEVVVSDGTGAATTSVDIASEGMVSTGDVRFYQLWYRDSASGPCGAQFNTSNALEITWLN